MTAALSDPMSTVPADPPQLSPFALDCLAGLSADPKSLPCRWLYDDDGSQLFERITELEEYYPTRVEEALIAEAAPDIVFHCADDFDGDAYYESIDLIDGYHPQTILAWGMNDQLLSVGHGARSGSASNASSANKQAKYIMRIELVDSLASVGAGKGGYWEDSADYQWYAGI